MTDTDLRLPETEFISHYVLNAPQLSWFLGAGTSRSAGIPAAVDITWDLKRRYYCLMENQDIRYHDLNNRVIKDRIQNYMDSQGFPPNWSAEEYSFYFELTFGKNYAAQQKYLAEKLSSQTISLNIGHRALAALLAMGTTKLVFTTNFDEVLETAYAAVAEKNLTAFHLEGSYAALEALNAERFPVYAKLHGDFRYQKLKNLAADLVENEKEIERCFLAASNRYGMVVSGYSGRDSNVMAMFRTALNQSNPFPHGLFWTIPTHENVSFSVRELITLARKRNVQAAVVEVGTFDIMLSKIWRQLPHKSEHFDLRVRTNSAKSVSVPRSSIGQSYPVLRMNALEVTGLPDVCGSIECKPPVDFGELNAIVRNSRPDAIITYSERVLFFGNSETVSKLFSVDRIKEVSSYPLSAYVSPDASPTVLLSFLEHALCTALCRNKPLRLRKKGRSYFAVVNHEAVEDPRLSSLKSSVGYKDSTGLLVGQVPKITDTYWAEAVELKLDRRDGKWWLLINPDIWVTPISRREECVDFLRQKVQKRYNLQSYHMMSSWIELLCGSVGSGETTSVECYSNTPFPARYELHTRTAYSRRGASNVQT